jgi:ABC-type transport system involved in multi-copper enzyme maturation permease subunit
MGGIVSQMDDKQKVVMGICVVCFLLMFISSCGLANYVNVTINNENNKNEYNYMITSCVLLFMCQFIIVGFLIGYASEP